MKSAQWNEKAGKYEIQYLRQEDIYHTDQPTFIWRNVNYLLLIIVAALFVLAWGFFHLAHAEYHGQLDGLPPKQRAQLMAWYEALHFPHSTDGCCGKADCWTTSAVHDPSKPWNQGWRAIYRPYAGDPDHDWNEGMRWIDVSKRYKDTFLDDDELPGQFNLTGEPVLCASMRSVDRDPAVYCFTPAPWAY